MAQLHSSSITGSFITMGNIGIGTTDIHEYKLNVNGNVNIIGTLTATSISGGGNTILTTANYNSYAPTLTGGGASGTWGINVTGNSATTSQTNFATLTLNNATVATQTWVTSQGITSGMVTTALGYTPVTNARTLTINGTAYDLSADRSWTIAAGVTSVNAGTGISVNSSTGAVTVTNSGVTSLTAGSGISVSAGTGGVTVTNTITNNNQLTNGAGYITGITSGMVTTALGYTPYNSSNPSGYITGITSDMVTTALGYTPYNSSNPSGYITSAALSSYLPLSGGTMSGNLTMSGAGNSTSIIFGDTSKRINVEGYWMMFKGHENEGFRWQTAGQDGVTYTTRMQLTTSVLTVNGNTVWHQGNLTNLNQLTNGPGYITGITSGMVTTALGYTPYNSSNPSGYITGITSGMVTTALGYTPYNSSNPSGYITSAALSSYVPYGNWSQSTGMNDSKLYLRTNGDNNHYLWNASDDWEELNAYEGTGFRIMSVGGTVGVLYVYGSSNGGYTYSPYSFRAPIFYDSDNTGYYVDPASTSVMLATYIGGHYYYTYNTSNIMIRTAANGGDAGIVVQNSGGTFKFQIYGNGSDYGFLNGTWAGWDIRKTATGNLYLNGQSTYYYGSDVTYVYRVYGTADMRSPIYYDLDNTGYYLDPASTSNLNILNTAGVIQGGSYFRNNGVTTNVVYYASTSETFGNILGGVGGSTRSAFFRADSTTSGASVWWGRKDGSGNNVPGGAIDNTDGEFTHWINSGGTTGSWTKIFTVNSTGIQVNSGDLRAPIFYDSNNTGYYLDPASTSNLNSVSIATLNGYTLNADNYLGRYGNSYYQGQTWIQMNGNHGLYWPSYYGGHFYPNNYNTHTQFRLDGSKNNYGGIVDSYSGVTGIMYDSGGNGGVYREANGRWYWYHHLGNNCMGVGTSTTNSSYGIYVVKGGYFDGRVDGTIFYDSNNTGYYVDPASTSNLNGLTVGGSSVLTTGNYNSYSPTLTGGNASGTWGISISGKSETVTVNYNNDSNSTYQMLWGSGNSVYGTAGVYVNPYTDYVTATSFNASDWFRSSGTTGWYNGTYAVGIYAIDGTWVRTYNNAQFYSSTIIQAGDSVRGPIFYDSNDTSYYVNPNGTARLSYVAANAGIRIDGNEDLYLDYNYGCSVVGVYASTRYQGVYSMGNAYKLARDGTTTGNLYGIAWSHPNAGGAAGNLASHGMLILENGGFQGAWGGGSLRTPSDVRGTIFYDWNNTGYYCDPSSTSNLNTVTCNDWYYLNGSAGMYWNSYSRGFRSPEGEGNSYGTVTTVGSGRNGWNGWGIGSRHVFMSTGGDNVGVHDNSRGWIWYWNGSYTTFDFGYTQFANSARSPIFYDNNDTGYYCDPASTSRLNDTHTNQSYTSGWFRNYSNNTGLYNQNTTQHWSSKDNGYWDASSTNTVSSIRFWTGGHISSLRGYVFANNSNEIGFQDNAGDWTMRTDSSSNCFAHGTLYSYNDVVAYYSDERLKTKTGKIENALDKVMSLEAFTYTHNELAVSLGYQDDKEQQIGLSAQDVQKIAPELVTLAAFDVATDEEGSKYSKSGENYLTIKYDRLVPVLIEAIKEQQKQIDELKARLG